MITFMCSNPQNIYTHDSCGLRKTHSIHKFVYCLLSGDILKLVTAFLILIGSTNRQWVLNRPSCF